MKYFIHSLSGAGTGLAVRLKEEGNDVQIYVKKPYARKSLTGIVDHAKSVEEALSKKPDVVIFDMSEDGKLADKMRGRGLKVIGAGDLCDLLELDRSFGMKIAKKVGIPVPEFHVFQKTEIDKAMEMIFDTGKRYVLKPHGNMNLDMTYVAKGPEDMIQELEWIKDQGILKGEFILQEFIKGIEISTEVWFSDGNPVPRLSNGTIEVKKFLTGNLGPATGCESSVVWRYDSDESKIVKETVKKMYPIIKEYGYSGPIDINCIVSEGKPYFLEFTPRLGYSAIYALMELVDGDVGEFFYNLAYRRTSDLELEPGVSMALTVSIPPYPLDPDKPHNREAYDITEGRKIMDIPDNHFWMGDVKMDKKDLVSSGTDGIIGYTSSCGWSVEEAEEELYEHTEKIHAPDMQYRMDAAERAIEDIPKLKEMGYDVPYIKIPDEEEK